MLAELAAANAAFAVIKQAVQNGKDIASAGHAIAEFVRAKETLAKGEGIVKEVIEGAKETVNLAVEEVKTIAPDVVDVFEESSERLNQKPRIVSAIPNDFLVLGLIALTGYVVIKKVL